MLQAASPRSAERVFSIDVFRGLTMLAMILVNALDMGRIRHVPWWLGHARFSTPNPDFMTLADVIAPAFLFIVGVSIPFAFRKRLERGDSPWRLGWHVLVRTASLMIIGIFMGNMRSTDVLKNSNVFPLGMSHAAWSVLLLASFMLVWNDYPKAAGFRRAMFVMLRLIGVGALIWLAFIYRQRQGDAVNGMKLRWYVVGTIGWSYLTACVVYLFLRRDFAAMLGCYALLIVLNIGDRCGALHGLEWLGGLRRYVAIGHMIGGSAPATVAGLIVGMLFMSPSPAETPSRRIRWILLMAAGACAAGWLLRPLYGLCTPKHTPTWTLYCTAWSCAAFAFLYWLTDVRGVRRWGAVAMPAGQNPLVAYFLSFMLHPLTLVLGIGALNNHLNDGFVGVLRTLCVAIVLGVFVTGGLTRLGVRLRL